MKEEEKQEAINEEIKKLTRFYKKIDKNKRTIIDNLIQQAAFIKITLLELQDKINKSGSFDLFQQGLQKFERESPAMKSYNATIKNYQALCKQLLDMLPEDNSNDSDDFLDFIKSNTKG